MKAAHIKHLAEGFGRALLHFRSSRFTTDTLAQTCGISAADVARMEGGTREPTLSEFLRLALALNVAPSQLFNRAVAEWPDDPDSGPRFNRSMQHHPRLFRLVWVTGRRTLYESRKAYGTLEDAQRASVRLNVVRARLRLPRFVGVGIYIRTGHVWTVRMFPSLTSNDP